MTYVISDLHGQLDSYRKLLEKIRFRDTDTLYLLGDMLDCGDDGIEIVLDAMSRPNVFPILGDREFTAIKLLTRLCAQEKGTKPATPSFQRAFADWLQRGGMPTVTAFRALEEEDRESVLEYLREECVPYEEVTVGKRKFLLVHAGIAGYEKGRSLDDYEIRDLIHGDGVFPVDLGDGTILVTGHTPVDTISPDAGGRILFSDTHIALDCGAADGGFAGCLCLDTLEAYYA